MNVFVELFMLLGILLSALLMVELLFVSFASTLFFPLDLANCGVILWVVDDGLFFTKRVGMFDGRKADAMRKDDKRMANRGYVYQRIHCEQHISLVLQR